VTYKLYCAKHTDVSFTRQWPIPFQYPNPDLPFGVTAISKRKEMYYQGLMADVMQQLDNNPAESYNQIHETQYKNK
jgi:hypothetical protein